MEDLVETRIHELDVEDGVSDSISDLNTSGLDQESGRGFYEGEEEREEGEEGREGEREEENDGWIDILGSGQLFKKTIKPGTGARPERGQKVTITYSGNYEGKTFEEKQNFWFVLGEGEVVQAFDIAIALIEVGEVALVKSAARFAYGQSGFPPIVPPDAEVEFSVEIISSEEFPRAEDLPLDEKISYVEGKRDKGNKYYTSGEFDFAEKTYIKAVEYAEYNDSDPPEKMKILLENRIKCLNNLVMTSLKLEKLKDAISYADKVLEVDEKNFKALFRKGTALLQLREYDDAITNLSAAAKLDPQNSEVRTELSKAKQEKQAFAKKEKAVYSSMLQAAGRDGESPQETPSIKQEEKGRPTEPESSPTSGNSEPAEPAEPPKPKSKPTSIKPPKSPAKPQTKTEKASSSTVAYLAIAVIVAVVGVIFYQFFL